MFGKKVPYIFKKLWFEVTWNIFVADRVLTNRFNNTTVTTTLSTQSHNK